MMQDCSQRNFFPNALAFSVYGDTLFDANTSLEATRDDYFAHAYGEAAEKVKDFFVQIEKYFPHEYVEAIHSKPVNIEKYRDPARVPGLEKTLLLCDRFDEEMAPYRNMPTRVQTVAVRLLGYYTEYLRGIARAFLLKAQKKDEEAKAAYREFFAEFGKKEIEIERYYDQSLAVTALNPIFNSGTQPEQ